MSFGRSPSRLTSAKSQERLIGGLKPTNSPELSQHHQFHHHVHHTHPHVHDPQRLPMGTNISIQQQQANEQHIQQPTESPVSIEKFKRSSMKAQATQTDCYPVRKFSTSSRMSLSPRTVSRVSDLHIWDMSCLCTIVPYISFSGKTLNTKKGVVK